MKRILLAIALIAITADSTHADSRAVLAGTHWRLVEFQSMSDEVATRVPHDSSLYLMQLNADGSVTMQLDCNRAAGSWAARASDNPANGRFEFGPIAATRMLCPPPSMDEFVIAQAQYVRGYLLKDSRLYLSLMADGGIFVWEAVPGKASPTAVPASPEDGGTHKVPVS